MALDKLARISPAGIHNRPLDWDAYTPSRERRQQTRRRAPQKDRLLALAAPGHDPAELETDYRFDAAGTLLEVVIRERATGRRLAVLHAEDIQRMSRDATPGMLVERKG